jgi:uncharacterized protein with HEPN domain
MRPNERDAAYLLDMLQAAEKVRRFVHGIKQEEFVENEVLRDAVERNIEIIGEAARKVTEAFKKHHPEIPWRKIIAQRNVLVHEYDKIGVDEMWSVVTFHVPNLIQNLAPLIPPTPPEVES